MRKAFIVFLLTIFSSNLLFAYDIQGQVKLKSPYPQAEMLKVPEKHCNDCGKEKLSPKLKISKDGSVANAVIRLEGSFPASLNAETQKTYVLDQINCEFAPHVMLVPVDSTVTVLNSEAFIHDVRAYDERAKLFFYGTMPTKGQKLSRKFNQAGRFVMRCGFHKWMYAFVVVQDHPYYALTDENGNFKISGVPDGNYTLSVWHETLGEVKTEVGIKNKIVNVVY